MTPQLRNRREFKARSLAILRLARMRSIFGTPQYTWEEIGRTFDIGGTWARRLANRVMDSRGHRRLGTRKKKRMMS